jgi:lipopolysaccharide/colanic/teichoic acid biosynthesis glycosyltransferase
VLDVVLSATMLMLLAPVVLALMLAIKLESAGPAIYRCRRVGLGGSEFWMLKLRKMYDGARGPALTAAHDKRFTRIGRFLARTKLDEIPQLWNVLKGDMSLVGPRPEDPEFVKLEPSSYDLILRVRPGITGLSQLAFARESEILDPADRAGDYLRRIFPQKIRLDRLYASKRTVGMDLSILFWTLVAVVSATGVAVNRETGALNRRRRPFGSALEGGGA